MILVTGATGTVGRNVVEQLLQRGARVRALTRNALAAGLPNGVEVVEGDLDRPETLTRALDRVDRLHLFPVEGTVHEVVELAKLAGVQRIVVFSGSYNDRVVERAVEDAGVEWTHLRPVEFMANARDWAPTIRTEGVVREPFGTLASTMIHEADIAAVAVAALLEDGHDRQAYALTGPEPITRHDAVRAIGEATGKEIRFEELTLDQARENWRRAGMPDEAIEWLLALKADPPSETTIPQSTVEDVTGRPARTFMQWATEHASEFR